MSDKRRYSLFPKLLGQCVEPLTRPLFKKNGLAGTRILTEWPSIVGHKLSLHCIAEKLSFPPGKQTGGTLTLAVENGFSTEIQYMQPLILERINGYFGYQAVTRIAISPGFLRVEKPVKPVASPVKKNAGAFCSVEEVQDQELQEALKSLANTLAGK